jgi:hypothetical protein
MHRVKVGDLVEIGDSDKVGLPIYHRVDATRAVNRSCGIPSCAIYSSSWEGVWWDKDYRSALMRRISIGDPGFKEVIMEARNIRSGDKVFWDGEWWVVSSREKPVGGYVNISSYIGERPWHSFGETNTLFRVRPPTFV